MLTIINRAFLVSDPLQEYNLGRRGAIAIACLLSMAATIGQSFSKTVTQLAACRAVTGLTLAAKASTAPLLIAEVSPRHLRGKRYYKKTRENELT
jgi:MFS family permease